jgi:hypothetical protein
MAVEDNVKVCLRNYKAKWSIIGSVQREQIKQYILGMISKITVGQARWRESTRPS